MRVSIKMNQKVFLLVTLNYIKRKTEQQAQATWPLVFYLQK